MISSVYIRGFRGIREGFIDGLERVTLLIGRNGAGKSSILEAIYLASACANPQDEVRRENKLDYVLSRRGGRGSWNETRRFLWFMGSAEAPIEVHLGISGKRYKFVVVDVTKYEYPVKLETAQVEGAQCCFADLATGYAWLDPEGKIKREFFSVTDELARVKRFLEGILFIDGVLARRPDIIEAYAWPRVLQRRLDKIVTALIKEEFELEAEGFTYAPIAGGYYLMLQTAETAVRVDDLGDGARSALTTAMLVLAYKPTVVLIEEPELHMHPRGLYVYMKFLMRLAKDMDFQVIASTHSVELVQIAQMVSQELGVGMAAFYLEREAGILKSRSFSPQDLEVLRKLGIDVRLLHIF